MQTPGTWPPMPHDDHVRAWRVATDANWLDGFQRWSKEKRDDYLIERGSHRERYPHRSRDESDFKSAT